MIKALALTAIIAFATLSVGAQTHSAPPQHSHPPPQHHTSSHTSKTHVNHGPYHPGEVGRHLNHDEFYENFGIYHHFYPRFFGNYDGFFWAGFEFGFITPYPVVWGEVPEIYVEEDGGFYYVYNPLYPTVRIAVVLR